MKCILDSEIRRSKKKGKRSLFVVYNDSTSETLFEDALSIKDADYLKIKCLGLTKADTIDLRYMLTGQFVITWGTYEN